MTSIAEVVAAVATIEAMQAAIASQGQAISRLETLVVELRRDLEALRPAPAP